MLGDLDTRNFVYSILSGVLFGIAWWVIIDIFAHEPLNLYYRNGILLLPPLLGTLSLIGNSLVPNYCLTDTNVTRKIFCWRLMFFFTMVMGFGGLCASIILSVTAPPHHLTMYGIIVSPVCNLLLLLANLMFKFGTSDGSEDIF